MKSIKSRDVRDAKGTLEAKDAKAAMEAKEFMDGDHLSCSA